MPVGIYRFNTFFSLLKIYYIFGYLLLFNPHSKRSAEKSKSFNSSSLPPLWVLNGSSMGPLCLLGAPSEFEVNRGGAEGDPRTSRGEIPIHPMFSRSPPHLVSKSTPFLS